MNTLTKITAIQFRPTHLPENVIQAIKAKEWEYIGPEITVLHSVCVANDVWCGVIGMPNWGQYEWFVYTPEGLEATNSGWGDASAALFKAMQHPKIQRCLCL